MVVKKSKLMFFTVFIVFLLISMISCFILPERYFYDTVVILSDEYVKPGIFGSYPFVILFYKMIGFRYLPFFLIALIQYTITSYILYKIGIPKKMHIINIKNIIFYIALLLLGIYMSMPTKEFITFLMFSSIPFILLSKLSNTKKILYSSLLILFFSFFRAYYLLIPIFSIGMYILSFLKFKKKAISTIFYGILIAVFMSFSHGILKGEYLSKQTREEYTEQNAGKVNTIIVSPLSQETWYGEAIGIFYGYTAVNLPIIQILKSLLSPQVIVFAIWEITLYAILFIKFSRCLENRNKNIIELYALLILFSYFIVQGIFEPDLGTSIRHKIGLLPIIYFSLYYEDFRRKT